MNYLSNLGRSMSPTTSASAASEMPSIHKRVYKTAKDAIAFAYQSGRSWIPGCASNLKTYREEIPTNRGTFQVEVDAPRNWSLDDRKVVFDAIRQEIINNSSLDIAAFQSIRNLLKGPGAIRIRDQSNHQSIGVATNEAGKNDTWKRVSNGSSDSFASASGTGASRVWVWQNTPR